jgi:uncharacterized membrane protein
MVTAVGNPAGEGSRLILMPHAPMTRRRAILLFSSIAGGVLGMAIVCGLLGAWQVMPLSLLVVGGVGLGIRSGYLRTQIREIVSITGGTIAIEKRGRRSPERHEFQRGWAQVVLQQPPIPTPDMSHLFIRSHGRQVEIGAFLDDQEKCDLAERLSRLMGPGRSFDACVDG